MNIHIISTINGKLDEGMRNVATHFAQELEKEHSIYRSGLKDLVSIIQNSCRCDCTLVFARGNRLVYWLARLIGGLNRNLWIVCVQKPEKTFLRLARKHPLRANYLCIVPEDLEGIPLGKGSRVETVSLGVDTGRFCPVSRERQKQLKAEWGFDPEQPLAVHVGHCSAGRGLTDFIYLSDVQKMVVASGMFTHAETVLALEKDGVRVHQGYLPNIEQVYQMADVYFFPTRSTEYVISLPLSVMEALSCGVPVLGYRDMENLRKIPAEAGAVALVQDREELDGAVQGLRKQEHCLLTQPMSWQETAQHVQKILQGE